MSFDINLKVDVRIPDLQLLTEAISRIASPCACKSQPPAPEVLAPTPATVVDEEPPAQQDAPNAAQEEPEYTLDQICKAAAYFLAANGDKMPQLLAMLQKYEVPAMTELKTHQLDSVAADLKAMGVQI